MPAEKITTTVLKDGDVTHVNTLRLQWGKSEEPDVQGYAMLEIRNHDEPDITRLVELDVYDIDKLIAVLRKMRSQVRPQTAECYKPGCTRPGDNGIQSIRRCLVPGISEPTVVAYCSYEHRRVDMVTTREANGLHPGRRGYQDDHPYEFEVVR